MIKLQQLHIYGFGKHINKTIQLEDGMNIFYGENEAGKTTIQQFILQIFFGFPQKNSTLARYEPKAGTRFGGQIDFLHSKYGECSVERVKGKASGDITVRLADGTVGQEELLAKVLYGYTRADFEAIFSFSLHELQGIERMSEEELSRVLLASGTTGVDQLTKVERKLEKEMGELYKKSGKNPLINQKLEQLKKTERRIQEEQAKIATYDQELSRLATVEQSLLTKQEKRQQLQSVWQNTSILKQSLPLLQEKRLLDDEIAKLTVTQFPADGIRRYEQLKDRLLHFDVKIQHLEEQCQEWKSRLAEQLDEERWLGLQQLVEKESEWHHLQASLKTLQEEVVLLKAEEDNHYRLLGINDAVQREGLAALNVSLQEEEKFQQLLSQLDELEEKYKMNLLTVERVRDELDEIKQRLQQWQQEEPTEQERQKLSEWPAKQQRLEQLKAQEQNTKKGNLAQISLLLVALAALTLFFGLWQKDWPVLIVGIVLLLVGITLFNQFRTSKEQGTASNLRQALHELRELEQEAMAIAVLKEQVQRYDDRLQLLQEDYKLKLSQYKKVELECTQIETEVGVCWEEVQQFLLRFYIDGVTQRKLLPDLFARVREVQRLAIVIANKQLTVDQYRQQLEQFLAEATKLTNKPCTKDSIFVYVREAFRSYEEQKSKVAYLEKQLAELLEQLKLESAERLSVYEQMQQLLLQANVQDERAFYEAHEQFTLYMEKTARLQSIEQQLQTVNIPQMDMLPTSNELEAQLMHVEQQQETLHQEIEQYQQEKAALQYSTNTLLTDEGYGQLMQVFEQQKAELSDLVKKWSMQKAIVASIEQTMQVLREDKLPQVLQQVNERFTLLTGGHYKELLMNGKGYFEAVAQNGIRYHVAELSQATKEQAYVALRFALAHSLSEVAPFPFIMDDPFVHFDRKRMGYMVQLMNEIEGERQILYFTCHESMKQYWQNAHVVDLSRINV